jgi:YHS domain-containing protein
MKHLKTMMSAMAFVLASALPAMAQGNKTLVNVDDSNLAIQGYDPVAFFTDNKPVKGDSKYVTKNDGAIYYFASKEHRDLFVKNPEKYEPVFGGYCAYGVAKDKLVEIDVNAFQIVDGKLFLQYSKSIRDKFNKDAKGNLAKADANWPALVEKNAK